MMDPTPPVRTPWAEGDRRTARYLAQPVRRLMRAEAAGGLALLGATLLALAWANADASGYAAFWSRELTVALAGVEWSHTLQHLVNDGLMAVFFLLVGLEVKRELVVGELSTRQAALLPLFAALGGMVMPALIYLGLVGGGAAASGWGIPMATDVAFALGALAALGRRVPFALVAFLLGVAVIDDIGAILVVALFYSDGIDPIWLASAIAGLAIMLGAQRIGVRALGPYLVLGCLVWFATLESGVHATIAAVAIGLITPVRPLHPPTVAAGSVGQLALDLAARAPTAERDAARWRRLSWLAREAISPLERATHGIHPWSSFVVLPIFALANAGIALNGAAIAGAAEGAVAGAVATALVAGKMLGLGLGCAAAVGLGVSRLPPGVRWSQVVGVGALAGIGFTVSLFISELAFTDPALVEQAKLGVLAGSVVAAAIGVVILIWAGPRLGGRR